MQRVRQRVLSVAYFGGAQDTTHGGEPAPVPDLSTLLQPAVQPQDPPPHTHRRQAKAAPGDRGADGEGAGEEADLLQGAGRLQGPPPGIGAGYRRLLR